jgi:DNA-binding transcriptional LysR family regulator
MADIETRLFRYFVALAEEKHFGRAATRLRITAPTLSHQIKKLEDDIETPLVVRKGTRSIELTEPGRRFLDHARTVLREVEEAGKSAQQAARGEVGLIRIGYQYAVSCAGVLQEAVAEFQRQNRAIEITIDHLITVDQIKAITQNELDIGFGRPPRQYPWDVNGFIIYRQPTVLALPADHRFAKRKTIKPIELAKENFVNPPVEFDLVFPRQTEAVGDLGEFTPKVVKRAADIFTVLTYVSAGYGLAVVSKSLTRIQLPNVVYRDIDAEKVPETIVALMHRRVEPSPAIDLFLKFMKRFKHSDQSNPAGTLRK